MSGFDIYETITASIIDAIEKNPGTFVMPWHRTNTMPMNALTGAYYRGINIVQLWCVAQLRHLSSSEWATYRQWKEKGAQVRKGEKSTLIVFYSEKEYENEAGEKEKRRILKWSNVFSADQVDGYTAPAVEILPPLERLAAVDAFVQGTRITVIEGGSQAFYRPTTDTVHMPDGQRFRDTKTSSRTENFYAVLAHELTHAVGHPSRLNRDLTGRFGDARYSMEELIAELGAAFLCARLGITAEPREDHASYIASWVKVLKEDKKAIFSAAARAQEACEYLLSTRPTTPAVVQ